MKVKSELHRFLVAEFGEECGTDIVLLEVGGNVRGKRI